MLKEHENSKQLRIKELKDLSLTSFRCDLSSVGIPIVPFKSVCDIINNMETTGLNIIRQRGDILNVEIIYPLAFAYNPIVDLVNAYKITSENFKLTQDELAYFCSSAIMSISEYKTLNPLLADRAIKHIKQLQHAIIALKLTKEEKVSLQTLIRAYYAIQVPTIIMYSEESDIYYRYVMNCIKTTSAYSYSLDKYAGKLFATQHTRELGKLLAKVGVKSLKDEFIVPNLESKFYNNNMINNQTLNGFKAKLVDCLDKCKKKEYSILTGEQFSRLFYKSITGKEPTDTFNKLLDMVIKNYNK